MSEIWKFPLNFGSNNDCTTIRVAGPVEVSGVTIQRGEMCVWLAKGEGPEVTEQFRVVGTGHKFKEGWHPIGMILDGFFVWHVLRFRP